MLIPAQAGAFDLSLIIQIVSGTAVTVAAGVITYHYTKKDKKEEQKEDNLDRLHNVMFGIEGASEMRGLVEVVDSNYDEIENNRTEIEELKHRVDEAVEDQNEMRQMLLDLEEKLQERRLRNKQKRESKDE